MNQFHRIHAIWNPHVYHGWGRSKKFFEGWYYKIVNESQTSAFAIIPGIAMDENGNKQSFIQVLDGINNIAKYHKFKAEEFKPTPRRHSLKIGNNYFSRDEISLDLPEIKGDLKFKNLSPWSNSFLSPGIMGPYSFIPFMECYHGIVSMDHKIMGSLSYKGEVISFDGGSGYLEKDWGRSFPDAYIWMQTNHFKTKGVSVKCSVANIPWIGSSFVGFICALWINNELIRFTTYNFCSLRQVIVTAEKVQIRLRHPKYILEIDADRSDSTSLASPIQGFMDGRIEESMTACIHIKLTERKSGSVIFEEVGEHAGLEVAGNYNKLLC